MTNEVMEKAMNAVIKRLLEGNLAVPGTVEDINKLLASHSEAAAAREVKDAEIEQLTAEYKNARADLHHIEVEARAILRGNDRLGVVVKAARNVQFKPQNDEPYLALQDTIKALDNK